MNLLRRALRALTFDTGLTAVEHPDGTYTLKDVPVFGEVAADSNGNRIAATPEWLRAAFDRGVKLQEEGFAGPVHVGHHAKWDSLGQAKDERERVGGLVLKDLRPHKVEGKVEQTIFADIVEIPGETFRNKILTGQLPHVSVEYIEEHRPAIDSLAMTGSSCPFKRYANVKVGRVVKAPKATAYTVVTPPAPSGPRGITFLTGGQMPDDKKADSPPAPVDEKKDEKTGGSPVADPTTGKPEAKTGDPNAQDPAVAPPWAVAMTQAFGTMVQTVQAIASKLGAGMVPGSTGGPAVMPSTSTAALTNEAKQAEAPAMDAKTFGELHGHVQTLLREKSARDKDASTTISVATFEAKVKGWPFDDSDRAALRKCVEAGGDIAAQAFIEQVQKRPKEMEKKAADFRASNSTQQDSPAVMKFVTHGPVKLEQARRFSAMHSQLVAAGLNPSPEDKFIENQFATAEANARANANKGDK